jgi:hypothetical protein
MTSFIATKPVKPSIYPDNQRFFPLKASIVIYSFLPDQQTQSPSEVEK